jgi:hypothetical protein
MALFEAAGVAIEWVRYDGYPEYRQLHGAFAHQVSIVDLLLMQGSGAGAWMQFAPHARSSAV